MLKLLIKKELKEIIGSSKFVYSFAVCALLVLLTFYVGAKSHQINKAQYDAAVKEDIKSMSGITDWRMINHRIFLPPQPLSSLVSGISNDIGRNIEMRGRGELLPTDSKYGEDPVYAVFRFLDLNFLFQIILSLFAILFCYNAVSGEKENGTLRLVFSNSIPRDKFILGKIFGSFLALVVPLLVPMLLGCLLLIVFKLPMNISDWLKLLMIIITGFLLIGVFINVSVFLSTSTQRSSNSFLMLIVIWVLFVLVIPKVSVIIAGRIIDVPSVDEVNSKKNTYAKQVSNEFMNKMSSFRSEPGADVMKEFQNFMGKTNDERDDQMRIFTEKVNRERWNKQDVQEKLAYAISRISPSASFSFAASNFAGTSLDLVRDYREQAENYQKAFAKFQIAKSGGTTGTGMNFIIRSGDNNKPPEINPVELPKYEFVPQQLSGSFSASLIDIGLLMLANIIFFGASYKQFFRYDLR
jgi:ABC-type transport system involved in multi-copper enzyme maturation permease subunit